MQNETFKNKVTAGKLAATTALMTAAAAFPALAEEPVTVDVATTLQTGFQSMANTMLSTINSAVPIILSVVGVVIAVRFGIRFFKGLAK